MYCCILVSLSLLVSSSFDRMFSNSLANFDLSADEVVDFDDDEAFILMPEEEDDDDLWWLLLLLLMLLVVVSLVELLCEGSTPRLMNGCGSLTALFTVLAMLRAAVAVWPPFCFFIDSTLEKKNISEEAKLARRTLK